MHYCVHDVEKPIMRCSGKLVVEKWKNSYALSFIFCTNSISMWVKYKYWQVRYLNFTFDHFWSNMYLCLNSSNHISEKTLLLSLFYFCFNNVCPFSFFFFFLYFWLLISVGALEIAGRVNTTAYSSSSSFPGGQKCIQALKERKYLPNWKPHQEDCFPAYQEKQPCDFSLRSVFRSNLTRCGFESQLCCLPVGWRRADYPDS